MESAPIEKTPGEMPPPFSQGRENMMPDQSIQHMEDGSLSPHVVPITNAPIIMYATSQPANYQNYKHRVAFCLGLTQVLCGIVAIVLQALAIDYRSDLAVVGTGIWTGIIFIVAGSFGIASSRKKTKCLILTTMVMSIIAASMAGALMALSSASLKDNAESRFYYYYENKASRRARLTVDSFMLIVATGQLVIAILQSVFCCHAVCCGRSSALVTVGSSSGTQTVVDPQTLGHLSPTITTATLNGQVVLAPQALGYPASTMTTTNSGVQDGQVPYGATAGIQSQDSEPPRYEKTTATQIP